MAIFNTYTAKAVPVAADTTLIWDQSASAVKQVTLANLGQAIAAAEVTVADESADTTCFLLFVTAATGNLAPKTNAGLTINSATGVFTAAGFSGPLTGNVTGNVSGSSGSCTGNAATVTTNANLTGPITSVGNATSVAAQTGTGSTFVMQASPTVTTAFTIQSDTTAQVLITAASDTVGNYPYTNYYKKRGTQASPTNVIAADVCGGTNIYGHQNATLAAVASFTGYVDSVVGNYLRGRLQFAVSDGTGGTANIVVFNAYYDRLQVYKPLFTDLYGTAGVVEHSRNLYQNALGASAKHTYYVGNSVTQTGTVEHGFEAGAAKSFFAWSTYNASTLAEKFRVTGDGNVLIGATAAGTSAVKVLGIKNGTAPTSSPADMVQLWAEDVASSSELKVRDEAANVSTISPHPNDAPDDIPYNRGQGVDQFLVSRNHYLGTIDWINITRFFFDPKAKKEECARRETFAEYNARRGLVPGSHGYLELEDFDANQDLIARQREEEIARAVANNDSIPILRKAKLDRDEEARRISAVNEPRLAAIRRNEAREVLRLSGIPEEQLPPVLSVPEEIPHPPDVTVPEPMAVPDKYVKKTKPVWA